VEEVMELRKTANAQFGELVPQDWMYFFLLMRPTMLASVF
jgi:hypothetical protein